LVTHSVGAVAEVEAAEVSLGDVDDGVGVVAGVASGVALVSTTWTDAVVAGLAVVDRPRIADTIATMSATTTTRAMSTTARRRR
jgi:hypothetical protein